MRQPWRRLWRVPDEAADHPVQYRLLWVLVYLVPTALWVWFGHGRTGALLIGLAITVVVGLVAVGVYRRVR